METVGKAERLYWARYPLSSNLTHTMFLRLLQWKGNRAIETTIPGPMRKVNCMNSRGMEEAVLDHMAEEPSISTWWVAHEMVVPHRTVWNSGAPLQPTESACFDSCWLWTLHHFQSMVTISVYGQSSFTCVRYVLFINEACFTRDRMLNGMGGSPGELGEELVMSEKQKMGWRMNCDVGEATEGSTLPLLHLRHSSFSNPSFTSPTS